MKHPGDRKFFNIDFLALYFAVYGPCRAYKARSALTRWKNAQDDKPRDPRTWYCSYFQSGMYVHSEYSAPNGAYRLGRIEDRQLWTRRRDLDRRVSVVYGEVYTQAHWELTPRGIDRAFIAAVKARRQGIDLGPELMKIV